MATRTARCGSVAAALVAAAVLIAPAPAHAGKLLRWNFRPGEQIELELTQHTETKTLVNGRPVSATIDMSVGIRWLVKSVEEDGRATIEQSFTRLAIRTESAATGAVAYDSAAAAEGPATGIAAAVQPLLAARVLVTLDRRGQILNVEIPAESAAALNPPSSSRWPALLTKDGLEQLLKRSLVVLPEREVSPGDAWSAQESIPSPLGTIAIETQYTYRGEVPDSAPPSDQIDVAATLSVAGQDQPTLRVETFGGTLQFNVAAGRLVASSWKQQLVSLRRSRDAKIEVQLTSEQRLQVKS